MGGGGWVGEVGVCVAGRGGKGYGGSNLGVVYGNKFRGQRRWRNLVMGRGLIHVL